MQTDEVYKEMLAVLGDLQESASYWSEYDVPVGIVERINSVVKKAKADDINKKYMELIMAVAKKFPGETRHETALRYIREKEKGSENAIQFPVKFKGKGILSNSEHLAGSSEHCGDSSEHLAGE